MVITFNFRRAFPKLANFLLGVEGNFLEEVRGKQQVWDVFVANAGLSQDAAILALQVAGTKPKLGAGPRDFKPLYGLAPHFVTYDLHYERISVSRNIFDSFEANPMNPDIRLMVESKILRGVTIWAKYRKACHQPPQLTDPPVLATQIGDHFERRAYGRVVTWLGTRMGVGT